MKNPLALLLPLLFSLFLLENSTAAIRPASVADSLQVSASATLPTVSHARGKTKKEGRIQRFFAKLKKWGKEKLAPNFPEAKRSLAISLGLLVLSIVLFASSSQVGFLSIIGSVTLFGAIVFFVLWLVVFTRGRQVEPTDE